VVPVGLAVDQVVGGVDAAEGGGEARGVEHVSRDDVGALRHPRPQLRGPTGHAAKRAAGGLQRVPEPAADVAARAGEEDEIAIHGEG